MNRKLHVNIPVIELTRRLFVSGGISTGRLLLLGIYYLKLILVMPVGLLQSLIYSKRISETDITRQPVFILGHYRSGTTYLHKLLAADKRFGFVTYYDMICPNSSLLFGNWLKVLLQAFINVFKIKTSFFNNTTPSLDEPAEEERFLMNKGSAYNDYWRFVFPWCWTKWSSCAQLSGDPDYYRHWKKEYMHMLKQITFKNRGRRLVLKSPPNTERIKFLLEMFPGAKFIYINRNPYHVFYSTCNLWQKAIMKFSLQKLTRHQMEEIVFTAYSDMMEQYEKSKNLIPAGHLVEIKYEELELKPFAVLEKIYSGLNMHWFEEATEQFARQLQEEKRYHKFEYKYEEEIFNKIESRWNKYIRVWKGKETLVQEYV